MARRAKKEAYHAKLHKLLEDYDKCFIVHADNVGSKQFMDIRKVPSYFHDHTCKTAETGNEDWGAVISKMVGNVGLVFTSSELADLQEEISKYKVGAPARVGAIAPKDVVIPAGGTGMDPSQTSFFQALGIATKINRGTIEIVTDVHLIEAGKKVGGSEATLLSKLGIKPFEYGLKIVHVYDSGSLYDPAVLDIKEDDIAKAVQEGIGNVAAVSLQIGYPTEAALPHVVMNAYKNVLSIALATDYSFPLADKVKEMLENPEAFMVAAPVAAAGGETTAAAAAEAKVEEEEEESEDEDMGFSLFD